MLGDDDKAEPTSRVPLYLQLERVIRKTIDDGTHQPGDLLPSEAEFSSTHQVSRTVVRRALDRLASQGLIRKEQGRGSVVAGPGRLRRNVQQPGGLFEAFRGRGLDVATRLIFRDVVTPPAEVAEFLSTDRTWRLDRVRAIDGRVIAYVRTFLPADRCGDLGEVDLETRSLYVYLKEERGIAVTSGRRLVEATGAEGSIAAALEVPEGEPILLLSSAGLDSNGSPIEWFQSWHRSDQAVFEIDILNRGQGPTVLPGEVMRLDHRPDLVRFAREARRRTDLPTFTAQTETVRPVEHTKPEDRTEFLDLIHRERLIARVDPNLGSAAHATTSSLADAGVRLADVNVTNKAGMATLEAAADEGGLLVGASGIRTPRQAKQAQTAGAEFIITPLPAAESVRAAVNVPVIPVVTTPSEAWSATVLVSTPLLVHPVGPYGADWLQLLIEDLEHRTVLASGGVKSDGIPLFLAAGAHAVRLDPPFGGAATQKARSDLQRRAQHAVTLAGITIP